MSQSPNFIDNGTVASTGAALPGTKVNGPTPQPFPANEQLTAPETNTVIGALTDIKTALARTVSIMSFGADPTGSSDSSGSFTAALAAISNAGVIHLPVGIYRLSNNIVVPAGVVLSFDSSTISIDSGKSLTINGQIDAPPVKIFSFGGTSQQIFVGGTCLHPLNAAWFGCVGDGTTDNAAFFKQAMMASDSRQAAFQGVPKPATDYVYPLSRTVVPAGRYEISATVEMCYGGSLVGQGGATLQSSSAIPLLRVQPAFSEIVGMNFAGGSNAIALCGYSTYYTSFLNPTAFGNAPCKIDYCSFSYQSGPSIFHDYGPVAHATGTPPAVPMTAATIAFDAVPSEWPSSGTIACDGCTALITYTGKVGNTLTGCAGGGTGAVNTSGPQNITGLIGPYNTGQYNLRVTNFEHAGACLYWGASDIVSFDNGHSAGDFSNAPVDDLGFPLGMFNTYDTLTVSNFRCDFQGTQGARTAIVVGASQITIDSCAFGQDGDMCEVRQRITANTYNGIRISGPIGGLAALPATVSEPLDLTIHSCYLGNAFEAMWLEIYETLPTRVSLKAVSNANQDFLGTYGVWLDRATIALPTSGLLAQAFFQFDFDAPPNISGSALTTSTPVSFFRGFDPGVSAQPTIFNSIDVSDYFTAYRERLDLPVNQPKEIASHRNLFNNQTTDAYGTYFGATNQTGTFADSTFGIAQTGIQGGSFWNFLAPDAFLDLEAVSAPAGIYCFSLYIKVNYATWLSCFAGPDSSGNGSTLAVRRLQPSDSWQRIEYPFYYPGNAANCRVNVSCPHPAQTVTAWPASTAVQPGQLTTNDTGKLYICVKVTGDAHTASSGGPTGTGSAIVDNHATWDYVGPGGTFTPTTVVAGWMVNKGYRAAPFVFAGNNDSAGAFGWVPRDYYGTAAPTSGKYFVGDRCWNTAPGSGGNIGWVCTTAGSPGTWRIFGMISAI